MFFILTIFCQIVELLRENFENKVYTLSMNRKILIADDIKSIRMILWRTLDKISSDWEIEEASDGEEALDRIYWSEPDIILLDVQLPKKDGWDILRSVREADKKTETFML